MTLEELLEHFNNGDTLGEDRDVLELMRFYSREAQKITMEINTKYHEPEELSDLFSKLTGKPVGEGFALFPPFYTDLTVISGGCETIRGMICTTHTALAGSTSLWFLSLTW